MMRKTFSPKKLTSTPHRSSISLIPDETAPPPSSFAFGGALFALPSSPLLATKCAENARWNSALVSPDATRISTPRDSKTAWSGAHASLYGKRPEAEVPNSFFMISDRLILSSSCTSASTAPSPSAAYSARFTFTPSRSIAERSSSDASVHARRMNLWMRDSWVGKWC